MEGSCTISLPWCKSNTQSGELPYRAEVYTSITKVNPLLWQKIVPAEKTFMGIPYITAFEQSISNNVGFRYLILYKNGVAVGVAVGQIMSFDGANIGLPEGAENASFSKRLLTSIVNRFSLRLLVLGNAFMTGEYAMHFCDESLEEKERFEILDFGLNVLVKGEKKAKPLSGVVIKDFFVGDEGVVKPFTDKGYLEFMVQPNMILDIAPEWTTFDKYLEAMTSKHRTRAKKALKLMDGIETRMLTEADVAANMPVMEDLYNQIIGTASFKLAKFDLRHVAELKGTMGDSNHCLGYFKDGRMVGFISLYDNEDGECVAGMMGMDKSLLRSHDLYLNILYSIVRFAIDNKSSKLVMGRTAMEIKSSLGAKPHEMYIYSRHLNGFMNSIIKPIMRRLTVTKPWVMRDPFK